MIRYIAATAIIHKAKLFLFFYLVSLLLSFPTVNASQVQSQAGKKMGWHQVNERNLSNCWWSFACAIKQTRWLHSFLYYVLPCMFHLICLNRSLCTIYHTAQGNVLPPVRLFHLNKRRPCYLDCTRRAWELAVFLLLLPAATISFSLDHKKSRKKMGTFWFFLLWFRRARDSANDSDLWSLVFLWA